MSATESTAIVEKRAKPNLFQRIKAQNLLSFGPEGIDLELGPLNVLIGPNGSGKSNLLELIGLFKAAPRDLARPVRRGGGVRNWLWQGNQDASAIIRVDVSSPFGIEPLVHVLAFTEANQSFRVTNEQLYQIVDGQVEYILQHSEEGRAAIRASAVESKPYQILDVAPSESILSQLRAPSLYPEFEFLSGTYNSLRLYRDWHFGLGIGLRRPQDIDVISRPMAESFANAGMFLNELRQHPRTKSKIIEKIRDIYDGVTDFELDFRGNTVQVYLTEDEYNVPATRLSDGTLRYLCLLAILLDPDPPPLIAIEEPELGLHPDLIPKMADLLVDASTRTQLVVTTHSEMLVDALHDRPDDIVVCEKHEGQTMMRRLSREKLAIWLEDYRLGDLWMSGQLGGVRW